MHNQSLCENVQVFIHLPSFSHPLEDAGEKVHSCLPELALSALVSWSSVTSVLTLLTTYPNGATFWQSRRVEQATLVRNFFNYNRGCSWAIYQKGRHFFTGRVQNCTQPRARYAKCVPITLALLVGVVTWTVGCFSPHLYSQFADFLNYKFECCGGLHSGLPPCLQATETHVTTHVSTFFSICSCMNGRVNLPALPHEICWLMLCGVLFLSLLIWLPFNAFRGRPASLLHYRRAVEAAEFFFLIFFFTSIYLERVTSMSLFNRIWPL